MNKHNPKVSAISRKQKTPNIANVMAQWLFILILLLLCIAENANAQSPNIKSFTGVNIQLGQPINRMKVVGFVREYHAWVFDEGYPGLEGIWEPASPGYPNNLYKWNPSYQTQSLGQNFDDFYQNINNSGVGVHAALMQSPPYIVNPDLIPDSYQLFDQLEQKPLFAGEDSEDPASYIEHADWMYHYAARFGQTVFSNNKLNQIIAPKLGATEIPQTGLGLVQYLENWNEPNKWWLLPTYPAAYFTSEEYAAMTSADYDGHAQTLSLQNDPDNIGQQISTVGVKNADPNMKFILSGIADLELGYLQDMVTWWKNNRPANAEHGQMPFDAINFHHYSNVNQNLNAFGIGGISPEEDDLKGDLAPVVAYRDAELPGKELWLTEFGYDTDDFSEMRAPKDGIGPYDQQEVQAQWIVRSYLEIAASGFDKAVMFELRDACTGDTCGLYQSSGLIESTSAGEQPKKSWYAMGTYTNVLGELSFDADLSPCQSFACNVDCPRVYRFVHPTDPNQRVYAVWSPSSCGKTFNHSLNLEGASSAVLVEMKEGSLYGETSALTGSSVNVSVSESPVFISVGQGLNTSVVPCVNNLTMENSTCNSARVSWQAPAGVSTVSVWKIKGSVDLNTTPFNISNAELMGDEVPASNGEFVITGLEQNSVYTIVVFAEGADGRTSEACDVEAVTFDNNCKIDIDPSWVFASSNPSNPPVELFDEQGIDPVCGTPTTPTSIWGVDASSPVAELVSIDLQSQYYIDAIYYYDGSGIANFTIEYANSPNGPWQILHTGLTIPFDKWITLSNLVSSTTPVRFLRFTGSPDDEARIGEVIICGTDSGNTGSIPPGPVTNLSAVFPSCNALMLNWDAPLDDDLDYYEISYPGGGMETIAATANEMSFTVFGLNENAQYDISVNVVDNQGLTSAVETITASTLPSSECNDDCGNTCDCFICLKESWVYDLSKAPFMMPTNLVDEQGGIDPFCSGNGSNPTTEYGENWDFNGFPPASFLLDLQQCHIIYSVSIFDSWSVGSASVEYMDGDGNWQMIEDFMTDQTSEWKEFAGLEITARFLRFTKNENSAKFNEIAVCGFPLSCETCPSSTAPDTDNDGVSDACDLCPGFDDMADGDMDGIPNGCDISCPTVGQSCDDNDDCTTGDVVDSDCNCMGTFMDSDNDGVCDNDDQCPGFDDSIDINGNGQPDGCEANCNYLIVSPVVTDAMCFASNTGGIDLEVACGGGPSGNLAEGRPATQSSTNNGGADLAVDGNTSGNFWGDFSVSATNWQNEPWWEVDLGSSSFITDMEIWGRTDCCQAFLKEYYILVSDDPFPSDNLISLLNDPNIESFYQADPAATPSTIPINANGRYVRIQVSISTLLFLAEVKVFGQGMGNCNFDYNWSGGIGNTANPNGLFAGNYGVTVTNTEDGCTSSTLVMVDQPDNLSCSATESQAISVVGGNDGSAAASANGGTAPYTYQWSDGATTAAASNLSAGNYTVTITDANGCSCDADVTLQDPVVSCNEGDPCNDFDNCTENDVYDSACLCAGTIVDSDGDGICDNDDQCPGSDDGLDEDGDGIPNGCDPCNNNLTGTSCNDFDDCTENDVYDADCQCAGTFADDDGDGVCNNDDLCEGFDDNLDDDGDGIPDGCDADSQCAGFFADLQITDESCFGENDGAIELTPPCTSSGGGGTGDNLALNKPATQSTTNWIATADKAVDGNTNGNYWQDLSIAETNWGANPWWEVDLGAIEDISEIEIWNRTDCCSFNLDDYYILVSDDPFVSGNLSDVLAQSGVESFYQGSEAASPTTVVINAKGRYVRVQLNWSAILALAEVVVKGGGTPDPTCDLTYLWSNGATTQNLSDLSGGNYSVTMTNQADGCVATASTTVQAAPSFSCDLTILNEVSAPGINDGSLEIMATGGTAPLAYQWSNGQSGATLDNLPPGNFSVTVTDANGCQCIQSAQLANPGEPPSGYCNSEGQAPWVEYIQRVEFAGVDHSSFKELYADNTDQTASVTAGDAYPITLTAGFSWLTFDEHWSVWIDYNQDGDFDDAGETALQINSNDPINSTINIPASATAGTTRMRVSMQRDAFAGPCEVFQQGEVEDYSVFISTTAPNPLLANDKIEFEAVNMGREVHLHWLSNMDDKTEEYILEHSTNGIDFQELLSFLPKTNEHSMELYNATHLPQHPGMQYYRLRQISLDGNDFTEIKTLEFLIDLNAFVVFPNPANRLLFIQPAQFAGRKGKVQISNLTGQILLEKEMDEIPSDPFSMDVHWLKDGLYFVAIEAEGRKWKVMRVVVAR